jgi:hypothetical protein
MRFSAWGLHWLLATTHALACTCVPPEQPLCKQLRLYSGSALFVGVVQKVDHKTIMFGGNKVRQQVVTLLVEEAFAGVEGKTVTITSFAEGGMCGVRFQKGLRYLVDAGEIADSTYLGTAGRSGLRSRLDVNSCGMTSPADYVTDSIRFLRTVKNNPTGAILFGTVKQYGKGSSFVSLNNKAVAGTSVSLQALPDALHGNQTRKTPVDSSGYYEFVGLPSGVYTHTVEAPAGFTGVLQHNVELEASGCAQVDVRVHPQGQ